MAPDWVLLGRIVNFVDEEEAGIGGASKEAAAGAIDGKDRGGPPVSAFEAFMEAAYATLHTMKPDPHVVDPPGLSSINLVRPTRAALLQDWASGYIQCTDKSLVVLYVGSYQPGSHVQGCCLIYDAMDNSLSVIPRLPDSPSLIWLGGAVLSHGGGEGAYVLAELCTALDQEFPDATLYLWWSSTGTPGQYPPSQWVKKVIHLPHGMPSPTYDFCVDRTFSFGGSCLCWVDLLVGVVICNLLTAQEPQFHFVPLPEGCSLDTSLRRRPRSTDFRYMDCVGGAIKFVAIEGYHECWAGEKMTLTTWTLSPGLSEWKKSATFCIGDIWASGEFQSSKLRQLIPMCPVLSMHEDDVVFVVIDDIEYVDKLNAFGDVNWKAHFKGQYVLALNMQRNSVLSISKSYPRSMVPFGDYVTPSEFSAYLHCRKDRQRGVEASEVEASGKEDEKL